MKLFKFFILFYLKRIAKRKFRFKKSFVDLEKTQRKVLAEILSGMSKTSYLEKFSATSTMTYEEFAKTFPVAKYEDLKSSIERQCRNQSPEVWNSKFDFSQWTSGSSRAKKEIPYTPELRKSFSMMFEIWLEDLLEFLPTLKTGRCYFSVSPKSFNQRSEIRDDFDYVRGPLKWVLRYFSVVPLEVTKITDVFEFKRITSLYLLAEENLESISVWSPSFLLQILAFIEENRLTLQQDLQDGFAKNEFGYFPLPKQACRQSRKLEKPHIHWSSVWPQLKFISCWGDGSSKNLFENLQKKIPGPIFQAKGLLATEAPITLPLMETSKQHPLIQEVFFEFKNENEEIFPLWQIQTGHTYELVISQKSGLLRYAIGDRVQLHQDKLISMSFEGRSQTSDIVGEKLNEDFLTHALSSFKTEMGYFVFLPDSNHGRYQIFTENKISPDVTSRINLSLRKNPHYSLAVDLGQLKELDVCHQPRLIEKYEAFYLKKGLSLGDIKFRHLIARSEEAEQMRKELSACLG